MDVFLHDDAVYGISVNPENSNVFATACDDGRILVYDMREPPATGISTDVSYSFTLIHVKYDFILPTCTCTSMFILYGIRTYMYSWVQMLFSGGNWKCTNFSHPYVIQHIYYMYLLLQQMPFVWQVIVPPCMQSCIILLKLVW